MSETRLLLPWPPHPSVLYADAYGGVARKRKKDTQRSEQYRRWLLNSRNLVNTQRPGCFFGMRCTVEIEACRPNDARFDNGDRREQVLTLLEECAVIDSRENVVDLELRWVKAGAPVTVIVRKIP